MGLVFILYYGFYVEIKGNSVEFIYKCFLVISYGFCGDYHNTRNCINKLC